MSDPTSIAAIQNISQQIALLNKTLSEVFPGATIASTVLPSSSGAITFSSSLTKGFMSVISSSGATYQVALY